MGKWYGPDSKYEEGLLTLLGLLAEKKINEEKTKIYDQLTRPICARIKNKYPDEQLSPEIVVREVFATPLEIDINEELISYVFEKLDIRASPEEITSLFNRFELESFEKQFDEPVQKRIGNFEDLSPTEFEDWLGELFSSLGYNVSVTKRSGDQGADLIATKGGVKTVVQAKKYQGPVSNKAVQEVIAAKSFYEADNAIVVTTGEFTASAIELANKANVELWDTIKLNEIMKNIKSETRVGEQSSNIRLRADNIDDYIDFQCPFCQGVITVTLRELSENPVIKCEDCGFDITIEAGQISWFCTYCKVTFDTKEECDEHEKSCPMKTL